MVPRSQRPPGSDRDLPRSAGAECLRFDPSVGPTRSSRNRPSATTAADHVSTTQGQCSTWNTAPARCGRPVGRCRDRRRGCSCCGIDDCAARARHDSDSHRGEDSGHRSGDGHRRPRFRECRPDPNAVNRWRAVSPCAPPGGTKQRVTPPSSCAAAERCAGRSLRLICSRMRCAGSGGPVRSGRTATASPHGRTIANARPMIAAADRVVICSNGLHAAKGRTYLRRQDGHLASKLAPALDYRVGEMLWAKPVFAAVGIWKLLRTRRST